MNQQIHQALLTLADDVFDEGAYEVAVLMRRAANELIRLRQVTTDQAATVAAIANNNRQLSHELARLQCEISELRSTGQNHGQH